MEKEEDRRFADLYRENVEGFSKQSDDRVKKHKGEINRMLERQSNVNIVDENDSRKKNAVANMLRSYKATEEKNNAESSLKSREKNLEVLET